MGVETSSVQIAINVVDNNSAAAVAGVEQNISKLGAAGSRSGTLLQESLGIRVPQATKKAELGMAGVLSSSEKTRLAFGELGIHAPRALMKLISKCPEAMVAINAVGSAMIALGAIQIGAMVFEAAIQGAQKLWDYLTMLPKAVQEYQAEVQKAKMEDFGNTHSIETTRLRIDEVTESIKKLREEAEGVQLMTPGWRTVVGNQIPGVGVAWQAHYQKSVKDDLSSQAAEKQRQADKLEHLNEASQWHEQMVGDNSFRAADRELQHTKLPEKDRLKAKHDDAIQGAREQAAEERRYGNEQDFILGNPVDRNTAGADKERQAIAIATMKANSGLAGPHGKGGSGASSEKSQVEELARLKEQALESGLRGSALYHAREAAAIADLKVKDKDRAAATAYIREKFHNEEMLRVEAEGARLQRMRGETALMGLTGVPRIQQEGKNRLAELYSTPGDHLAESHEIDKQTKAKVSEEQRRASDEASSKAKELADRHQRSLEDTERIEAQARVRSLSAEKQKTASIQAELDEKLRRYKEELTGQDDADQQYARRAVAAQAEADAEIAAASKDAHDKMAHEAESFFKGMEHPGKYFAELGDKAAGEAAASLFQRFQQRGKGGADAKGGAGSSQGIVAGTLSDVLGFDVHGFGKKNKAAANAKAEHPGGGTHTAAGTFSVASATIHVGSATFAGGGGASGGAGGGTTNLGTPLPGTSGAGGIGGNITGDAGSTSGSTASANFTAASPGIATPSNNTLATVGGNISSGYDLLKQGLTATGGGSDDSGGSGTGSSGARGKMNGLTDSVDKIMKDPRIQGGLAIYGAVQGNGGVGGALKGASGGMELGGALFGPAGAIVGAAAGAIVGAIGIGGREKAHEYDVRTLRPRLANDQSSYQQGSMDYLSAYADVQSAQEDARRTLMKMGPAANAYYQDEIKSEIKQAAGRLTAEQKAGRSQYAASGASYATGTPNVSETGLNWNHAGERIFSAPDNSEITRAVVDGRRGSMPVQQSSRGDVIVNLSAIDTKSGVQFLMDNKHHILSATNEARGENSGGGLN